MGKNIYNKNISWNEDIIIIYIIFNIANSFKSINKYGILHIISNFSATFTQSPNKKIYCDIFFLDIIFQFGAKKNKNYAIDYLIKNKRFNYRFMENKLKLYLKSVIKGMINCKYITKNNKKILKKKIAKINILEK